MREYYVCVLYLPQVTYLDTFLYDVDLLLIRNLSVSQHFLLLHYYSFYYSLIIIIVVDENYRLVCRRRAVCYV